MKTDTMTTDTDTVLRLLRLLPPLHRYIIVPFDGNLCREWARICVDRQRLGHPISAQDAWIAATALRHGCPLVTRNRDDFADIPGLDLISQT